MQVQEGLCVLGACYLVYLVSYFCFVLLPLGPERWWVWCCILVCFVLLCQWICLFCVWCVWQCLWIVWWKILQWCNVISLYVLFVISRVVEYPFSVSSWCLPMHSRRCLFCWPGWPLAGSVLNEKVSKYTPSIFGLRTRGSSESVIMIFGWVLARAGSEVNYWWHWYWYQ